MSCAFLRGTHSHGNFTKRFSTLAKDAEVVIIGGGAVGCSIAYHLAKAGIEPVLLEKGQVSSGTSWHAAGLVGQLRASKQETLMSGVYGCQIFSELEKVSGHSCGFRQTGSYIVARTEDRVLDLKRRASLARSWGLEADICAPEDVCQRIPLFDPEGCVAALWLPGDGTVTSSDVCQAYTSAARSLGAKFHEKCEVLNVIDHDNGHKGYTIETSQGSINTRVLVNSCGLWARRVGAMSGVNVPLHAMEHFYVVSKALPGKETSPMMPILRDPDHVLYFREWSGGILAGSFELAPKPLWKEGPPRDFEFSLLDDDWDHFEPYLNYIMEAMPSLAEAEIQMVNGPESFTPDNQYILGEAPEKRRYYVAAGMNSSGIASSGGMGSALAQWIKDDQEPYDLWKIDIRRFQKYQNNQKQVCDSAQESLGMHYTIGYPRKEMLNVRGVRRSPIYGALKAHGAQFGAKAGWERANYFGDQPPTYSFLRAPWFDNQKREHLACRNKVGLFDVSSFGKIGVFGADATEELQRMCSNNIDVPVGKIVYTQMLNEKGTIEADVTVHRLAPQEFTIITATSNTNRDMGWLKRNASSGSSFYVHDTTSATGVLSLMGPNSRMLLQAVTRNHQSLSNEDFPFGTFQEIDIGYARVRACRITYVGELGWELHVPTDSVEHVFNTLVENGEEFGLTLCGYYSIDSLRMESGYRAWGHELTVSETPKEAGLMFAVDKNKDFVGKSALEESESRARLVQFALKDPDAILYGGEVILFDGKPVGNLTSATYGWTMNAAVGMGYVTLPEGKVTSKKLQVPKWEIEVYGTRVPAVAQMKPLVTPKEKVLGNYNEPLCT